MIGLKLEEMLALAEHVDPDRWEYDPRQPEGYIRTKVIGKVGPVQVELKQYSIKSGRKGYVIEASYKSPDGNFTVNFPALNNTEPSNPQLANLYSRAIGLIESRKDSEKSPEILEARKAIAEIIGGKK